MNTAKSRAAIRIAAVIVAIALSMPNAVAADYSCAKDPHLVGACFTLHGRLREMANSRIKLWRVGTKRIMGVQYPGDMPDVGGGFVELPANIKQAWQDHDDDIFADFRVCPFSKSEPGIQQYVCIESAEHVFVKKACHDSQGYMKDC